MRNPFKGRQYFYVITKSKDGRLVVWMKDTWRTESEANQAAFNAIKGRMFVVVAKNFKDVSRVTQENKSIQLEESADLDGSIKRAVHDPKRLKFDERIDDAI
jgi:hypothetical protein